MAQTAERPNILICIADDAGFTSAYGVPWVRTPGMERVARDGIRFDNAFTCNAKSAPSRATLITGRNYVMLGKERHDVWRPDDQGYPIRAMIRGDFLYIRNYEPDRWPAGNPETGYMNVDGSPTKTEILKARRNPDTAYFWQLSFGKRQPQELYNITRDPECMVNLADDPAYGDIMADMASEMTARLVEEGDPRVFGNGGIFDSYPDVSGARQYYNRIKAGEKVPSTWISDTDFEPAASGLPVEPLAKSRKRK